MEKNSINKEKTIRIIKKVLSIIGYSLLALLVVMTIWLVIDKFIIKSPVPSFLGFSTLRVETGSMTGTINEGDVIVIFKTNNYKIGDIVTYIQEGDLLPTTHRIVLYEGSDGYITKGDFNNTTDLPESLGTTEGIIYTIVFILILYAIFFLINKKEVKEEENDEIEEIADEE